MTSAGVCVPPGPSRYAVGYTPVIRPREGKRWRAADGSKALIVRGAYCPSSYRRSGGEPVGVAFRSATEFQPGEHTPQPFVGGVLDVEPPRDLITVGDERPLLATQRPFGDHREANGPVIVRDQRLLTRREPPRAGCGRRDRTRGGGGHCRGRGRARRGGRGSRDGADRPCGDFAPDGGEPGRPQQERGEDAAGEGGDEQGSPDAVG